MRAASKGPVSLVDRVVERVGGSPWLVLSIAGRQFWLKKHFGPTEYALLVTDLTRVWAERRDAAQLAAMHRSFNPVLKFDEQSAMQRLDSKLDPRCQHMLAWREDTREVLQWDLSMHVNNLVNFCWSFDLHAVEADRAAELTKGRLVEPLLAAASELARQHAILFEELVRKDAELAALAKRGHKADRALRTERLAHSSIEERVEAELRARGNALPTPNAALDGPLALVLRHFAGGAEPAPGPEEQQQEAPDDASPAPLSQSVAPSSQAFAAPGSPSQSQHPPSAGATASMPPLSPVKRGGRGPAVVVDAGPKKKQKVVNRKNAFV
jgi:hypothetical protein